VSGKGETQLPVPPLTTALSSREYLVGVEPLAASCLVFGAGDVDQQHRRLVAAAARPSVAGIARRLIRGGQSRDIDTWRPGSELCLPKPQLRQQLLVGNTMGKRAWRYRPRSTLPAPVWRSAARPCVGKRSCGLRCTR